MNVSRARRFAPWAGLVAAPACWAIHQQGFATLLHFDCQRGTHGVGLLWFAVFALVLFASGAVSWRARDTGELRRFIAVASTLFAALAFVLIAFQLLATQILPGCGA